MKKKNNKKCINDFEPIKPIEYETKIYSLKELKQLFNLPDYSGGYLQREIMKLEKFYNLRKVGRGKYIIENKQDDFDSIQENIRGKYQKCIQPMIYYILAKCDENVTYSMRELMEKLQMVNQDFNFIKWNTDIVAKYIGRREDSLETFTKEVNTLVRMSIMTTLKSMVKKGFIIVEEVPTLGYKSSYRKNNEEVEITRKVYLESDDNKVEFLKIREQVRKEMELKNEEDINYHNRMDFNKRVASKYKANYIYTSYHILINTDRVYKEFKDGKFKLDKLGRELNGLMIDRFKKTKRRGMKNLKEDEINEFIEYGVQTKKDYELRKKLGGKEN